MGKPTLILTPLDNGDGALVVFGDGIVLNGSVRTRRLGQSQPIRVESRK